MDPLNAEMKKKVNTLSVNQKSGNENKEVLYLKNPALAHLEYVGEKSYTKKGDIKNDNQRLHFEELHASGMVHVCGSEAYTYVITSKQVLKSLCQL